MHYHSILESKVLNIWYQLFSHILGIFFSLVLSTFIVIFLSKFVVTPKPYFLELIKWAIFILIYGNGFVKINTSYYGLLTIIGRRTDRFLLSEGWWWLPPILFDHFQINGHSENSIIEISDLFSGGNDELHNSLPKQMNIKIGLSWLISDPILYGNRFKSDELLHNRFRAVTRKFVSKHGTTVQSLINVQDELKIELEKEKTNDLGIIIIEINVINIKGSEKVMQEYENLYNKIIEINIIGNLESKLTASKIFQLINGAGLSKQQALDFLLFINGEAKRNDHNINLNHEVIEIIKNMIIKDK